MPTDDLEPPRTCTRCGGRLDVQVYPTGYRASCRRCDGVHPARDAASIPVTRTTGDDDGAGAVAGAGDDAPEPA